MDEGLLSIKVLAALLVDNLKRLPTERLKFSIACRTVEWPTLLADGLAEWLGEKAVGYYVLAPLRKVDVEESARVSGLDPITFLGQIESSGAVPFAIKPVTLKFLLALSRKQGKLPSSQIELYSDGCRELAVEKSKSRIAAREAGQLNADQRLAVAARIAACTIFSNRNTIYIGTSSSETSEEDVTLRDLSGGIETDNDIRFTVTDKEIRETLATGLFSDRGRHRIGWGHQTYAEFLAASYLRTHGATFPQIMGLVAHPNDPAGMIIPQLGETAAWLAGMIPFVFQAIVRTEPDKLLRSQVATGDWNQRAVLAKALLQLYEEEKGYDHDRGNYKNLFYPELGNQLRPYIPDKTKGVLVRRVAVDITESCNVQSLNNVLSAVVLDPSDVLAIRVQTAYAIRRIGDNATREKLKPLLTGDISNDQQDELKGSILGALWPSHITAAELFPLLKPPKDRDLIGAYHMFLSSDLAKGITPENLVPTLQFASKLSQPRHEMDTCFESLMDGILIKAWDNMDLPGVTDALAKFVVARLKHHNDLIRNRLKAGNHPFLYDEDKRRQLLKSILYVLADDSNSKVSDLFFSHTPIVLSKDFYWFISWLDEDHGREIQKVIADLLFRLFNHSREHFEAIYEAGGKHPAMEDKFKWLWEPMGLSTEQAKKLKARYEEEQEWEKLNDKPPLHPSPAERLMRAIEDCENRDPSDWWRVTHELTLEPTSTDYTLHFESNVMKLPGWLSANEATRERIVRVAEKYVQSDTNISHEWLGTRQWSRQVVSQWSAVALLQKVRPEVIRNLSASQIEKWCPIIVAFPFLDNNEDRSVKEELLKLAYRKSPVAVLGAAEVLIEMEIEIGESLATASELNAVWDERVANFLIRHVKNSKIKPKSLSSLFDILFSHDNTEAYSFASSLVPTPPPVNEPERTRAIVTAKALMLNTKDAGWSIVWPAIQADEDFGRQFIKGINRDFEVIGQRLTEDQLADLYIWLSRHFKSPKPFDDVSLLRNAILQLLIHQGTFSACAAIRKLQQELSTLDWLKWVLIDAQTEVRRATWVPARPQDIVKLVADQKLRLIQSGDQLLKILVESLERLQARLQGARPQTPFLWDNASTSDAKPKDENMFSDYVANFLDEDLKQKGIVLNREVRIHRGQRTDIHIDAVIQTSPGQPYDSITAIIEVKGCWNPELYSAMKDQLIGMYLKDNHCQHGLYLVGWFNCDEWTKQDRRKQQARRLCPSIEETRRRLEDSATGVSKDSIRVKSLVLDVSLH